MVDVPGTFGFVVDVDDVPPGSALAVPLVANRAKRTPIPPRATSFANLPINFLR